MNEDPSPRLRSTFDELLALDAEARTARLATLAATDPALFEEVARLLDADADVDRRLRWLDMPFPSSAVPPGTRAPGDADPDAPARDGSGADPLELTGRTVSHFAVQEVLGAGGMGVVYRAEDLRLGRTVALKFLLPQYTLDAAAKERFLLEARAASGLDHPHICTIYEAGETEQGRLFLAMSHYAGETLRARLSRDGALPVEEAIVLARQIASGLEAAHAAGIVHRDLKPGNLMLTAGDALRILDFGLAKVRDLSLTGSGMRARTVAYMSPEQLNAEPVDARSDLWSLGVVLYEMLTGQQPFGGGHELSTVYRILHEEPVAPSTLRPEMPAGLEEVVLRLLRKEPGERYANAAEVLEALDRHGPPPARARPRRRHRGARHRVRLLGLAGVLVVAVLGTLATAGRGERMLGAAGLGLGETLLSRGVLSETERILLADFTSPTGDSLLAGLATEAFRIDLAQSPVLTLVEPQQVRQALGRMQRSDAGFLDAELARELAAREGIKAVLAGEIVRTGGGYLVSAQLLAAGSGEILAAHREAAADSTALLPALDRLSKRVRRRVGESLRSMRLDAPLDRVTTGSLDALRKYSQALRVLQIEGDRTRAVALLEEAIALDSTFAMAHRALAFAAAPVGAYTLAERQRAVEALTRAFELRDRLTDRERYLTMAGYYSEVTGERDKAIAAYRTLLDRYPHDPTALVNLADQYRHLGEWARAEELLARAWQADSSAFETLARLVMVQFNQGKFEAAEGSLRRLDARFPGNWRSALVAIDMAAARGNHTRAESLAVELRQVVRDDTRVQVLVGARLAVFAAVRGRLLEAERHLADIVEISRRAGRPGQALFARVDLFAMDILLRRDRARGLERLERALVEFPLASIPPHERPYPHLIAVLALAGEPERARMLFDEWQGLVPEGTRRLHIYYLLGEIAIAEGRPLDAVEHFRVASDYQHAWWRTTALGRAFDRAAQVDSAIARYEEFLDTPDIHRERLDAGYRAFVLERLGQLYEGRGDRARAAEYYARFIELWQDADEELQPRVREARRRLAALQ